MPPELALVAEPPPRPGSLAAGQRVLLVDDHELLGQILVEALHGEGIEAEACSGPDPAAVHAAVERFSPTIVLLDLDLGRLGHGCDLIPALCDAGATVVVLTGNRDRLVHAECLAVGAAGVLGKSEPFAQVLAAIEAVAERGAVVSPDDRHALLTELRMKRLEERTRLEPFERLTRREREVLRALANGQRAAEIADRSYVSVETVRSQIRAILVKLNASSQLAAVAMARRAGWLR